jgi:hypothetical protein
LGIPSVTSNLSAFTIVESIFGKWLVQYPIDLLTFIVELTFEKWLSPKAKSLVQVGSSNAKGGTTRCTSMARGVQ